MKTKRSKIILIAIVCFVALACGIAVWHFRPAPISPLTPQLVKDAKIPDGWYEHVVQEGGHTTRVVLTKHAELLPHFELDDLYDDPEIIIAISTLDTGISPEEYIQQYGTRLGTWGTLDAYGYKIFTFNMATGRDRKAAGHVVDMFKDNTLYVFMLVSSSNSALDTADFWQVINYYAQAQTPIAPPADEKIALAQLQDDIQSVTPHFIANNEGGGHASFTPEEQKIRDDLVALYTARYAVAFPSSPSSAWLVTAQNGIWLNAIGQRYLLVTEANVKSATDVILDVQTGQATPIPGSKKLRYYLAPERGIALYIDSQALYTYTLDQASATLVAGSQLSGTETYHDGYIGGIGIEINPQETHTKNSITISVFDSSKSVPNPDVLGATMYAKVGQKTLSF